MKDKQPAVYDVSSWSLSMKVNTYSGNILKKYSFEMYFEK